MPLIDDEVRALFPGRTDEEIKRVYQITKAAAQDNRFSISETDISLAIVARELGWEALLAYLDSAIGLHYLSADDIFSIAQAARVLRLADNERLYSALYGSASEVSSKKTISARKKGLKELTSSTSSYNILKGV